MDSTYMPIARLDDLVEDAPAHAAADGIDLVLVRRGAVVHVFEGRCPHRGALLADGRAATGVGSGPRGGAGAPASSGGGAAGVAIYEAVARRKPRGRRPGIAAAT